MKSYLELELFIRGGILMNSTIRYTIRPYDTIWMLAQIFNTTVDSIMELNPGIEPRNLMIGQVITIKPGYQTYPSYSSAPDNQNETENNRRNQNRIGEIGGDVMELRDYFRMLWEQHVEWTMMTILAMVHELPETDRITQRLLRNPTDFANALAPFYGETAAQEFARLFTEHLTIGAEIVQAAMAGDNTALTEADQKWYANAEEIAALLSSLNPYWNEDDWSAMLNEHLNLLSEYIDQVVSGDYEDSMNTYDEIEIQALEMADMMSEGIAMQFPG